MSALRIGVCGNGTVAGGTIELLRGQAGLLAARAGRELRLTRIGARRDREDCPTFDVPVHRDLLEVARAEDVDVLVECIGGTELAKELVETALRSGKSVVTANKALIAEHGNALLRLAEDMGQSLLCEAAVAGAIPILKALRDGMAANRICAVSGIINGTGNFILTEMGAHQRPFGEVLAEAQALGYAEADPSFDIEGTDAAHKLSILASMAFSAPLKFSEVYCEGIAQITTADIRFADELGYRIKHLGIAKEHAEGMELRVHPTLLP
jgi:homoserine dehydrogenase